MINSQQEGLYRLNSNSSDQIALKSVEIIGQVEGWILTKTLRQKYQNNTEETLEVSYAFPISYDEVLLAMNVTLDDKKLAAKVIERKQANEQYEDAVEKGDTPIMVELNDESGIATVNLGNLKPNAIAELEIVSAIPLRFAQGKIRFALPATIAPRYGDPIKDGGMREHDAVNVDVRAEYPLTIRIELQDAAAHAAVSSPSHAIKMKQEHEKTIITLAKTVFLDRDFILILDDIKETSTTLIAPDENEFMTQTTFYAPIANNTDPIFLKILVDCSGSMGGDSIAVAKRALKRIVAELTDKDFITYSRFGSSIDHKFSKPTRCSDDVLKKLNSEIDQTDANLGGTEMERALLDVFQLGDKKQDTPSAQVLLITDGEVWNSAGVTNSAKISGHRVFVVGVGASSAEHTLSNLAKETGGAYESISPNESGAEVITRSFYKMRGGELRDVKIEWDKKPLWESELPKIIYCGETLRVFAQFQSPPEKPPVLSYVIATEKKELTPTTFAQTDNPIITKLGGAKKYDDTQSHESKLELSLRYQLLTPQTALLLIFENVIKADGTPTLQKVPQMLAAGWGGTSSVDAFACGPFEDAAYDSGCDWYQLSVDVDESECRKMPPSGFRSMESRKKFSPRIDSLENIFQSVRDAKSNDDDEKLARKLWKDQNWINKIPSGTVEAEQQITAQTEYQQKLLNFLGMEYKGVGKIVAVNVTIYMVEQYDRVLLGYDETKNIVTIIVYNGSYYASLRDVLNSYISSKVVNKEKLLQDFNLPADAQISAAVLVGRSEQWVEAIFLSYKNLDRLIEKLKVTIIRQH